MTVMDEAAGGSSPRARGTDLQARQRPYNHRFIPAGAGNSYRIADPDAQTPVHPRGRGEQT